MTAQDKNIAIAEMLGWKKGLLGEFTRSDSKPNKEGMINIIPSFELKFHSDSNWQLEAKKWIVETNFNISPQIHRMYFNIFACQKTVHLGSTYKVRIHSDFKDVNIKVDSDDEKEAIFEALYLMSQYLKNK